MSFEYLLPFKNIIYIFESLCNFIFNNGHVEQQVCPNPETLTNHSCCYIFFLNMGYTRRTVAGMEMQGKSVTNHNIFKVKYSVDVKRGNGFELLFFPNKRIFAEKRPQHSWPCQL